MKLCVAQTRPVKGDVRANIAQHLRLIQFAVGHRAEMVVFPELSITGYEPGLARELAMDAGDARLDGFQRAADEHGITIGVGLPTPNGAGVSITLVLFRPLQTRLAYSKQFLHTDEVPFFVPGEPSVGLLGESVKIAPAICYEISVPEHAERAFRSGAEIYLASVAKSPAGVAAAIETLSQTAQRYSMLVVMVNCVGYCDNFDCGGRSSAWDRAGNLLGQLNGTEEGILVVDTDTLEVVERMI